MGWPSLKEDNDKRREDAGLPPADDRFRKTPTFRPNELAKVRAEDVEKRLAYGEEWKVRRRKDAPKRFVLSILRKIGLIK